MECARLTAVFGERMSGVPISSNKSMIGHTLTAAGAIEAVFSLLTMRHRPHPADHQLPRCPTRPSRSTWCRTSRATPRCARVLSNSFGFGGQNVCLVLGAEPA